MNRMKHNSSGFTVLEIMVSSVLMTLALAMAMGGFLYVLKNHEGADVQYQLDLDTRKAIERLKGDLRLSSLDKMVYCPATGTAYQAVSFPMADDSDGDGILELDGDEKLIWDRTVIYHIYPGSPDELRVTTFFNRNTNSVADAGRQGQLNTVVAAGHGASTCFSGETTSTYVIFRNLFRWEIRPSAAVFDGYAATTSRAANVDLGSCILSNGSHRFVFTVIGRNASSTGYRMVHDALTVSPSDGMREVELQSIGATNYSSGATVTVVEDQSLSWSEKNYVRFDAVQTNAWLLLNLENDRWEESQFSTAGDLSSNTVTVYDSGVPRHNYVLQLSGKTTNWYAYRQVSDPNELGTPGPSLDSGSVVRVVIKGLDLESRSIDASGAKSRLAFRAGSTPIQIQEAWIAQCASGTTPEDAAAGTFKQLFFTNSAGVLSSSTTIDSNGVAMTTLADYPIEREKSYLVTFSLGQTSQYVPVWMDTVSTQPSCYVMTSPPAGAVTAPVWSSLGGFSSHAGIPSLSHMYCTYASTGVYESAVYDTRVTAPVYSTCVVSNAVPLPSGSSQIIEFRTADNEDMSDSSGWAEPFVNSLSALDKKRYIQFRATMMPSTDTMETPKLALVTVKWPGVDRVVNVGGTFGKGPNHGIFELTVDGVKMKSGITVDLELYRDTRGFTRRGQAAQVITSFAAMEVRPRNSGK